ncbi:MAG: VanZ family protein, partial [Verrucomicrobiota bacterium]
AHLTEYAILAVLLVRALRKLGEGDPRRWSWRQAWWTVLLVALYAASDEFHQIFVPTREASVRDVMIDTIGGIAGLLLFWAVGRWRNWWGDAGAG